MMKNIFIDLDNTILDFDRAERIAVADTLKMLDVSVSDELLDRYNVINDSQWKMLERGEITREDVKVHRYILLFEEFGIKADAKKAAELYEHRLSQGHFFVDYAEQFLMNISKTHRLFLVSNGTTVVQNGRLESAGISKYFDKIFVSEEIGEVKPNLGFFLKCFEQIEDFCKEESIIIGDSLTSDILGGINAGIQTIWFNPRFKTNNTACNPDYEVHSLCEAEELINRMQEE